jgi:LmbE family N-acetylglucosaminyl deacetylase
MILDRQFTPVILPHYQRRHDKVFFLISRREAIVLSDSTEAAWFDAIDGRATIAELEEGRPGIVASLEKWAKRDIVKFMPPDGGPSRGPHALVIEPHMDDAIVSLGGRLINRSGRQRTTILSVTRWSSYTSYLLSGRTDFTDVQTVTQLRMAESEIAARMCGARFVAMDESDAIVDMGLPLRPDTLPRFHRTLNSWGTFGPTEDEVAGSSQRLLSVVRSINPDELWIPMGLGPHVDHVRTRQACLEVIVAMRPVLEKKRVFLYRDLPYARQFPYHPDFVLRALASAGARLVRRAEDITDVFEDKVSAMAVYASQWKASKVRPVILDDARSSDRIPGLQETYYEMLELPRHVPRVSEMSFDWPGRAAFAAELQAWLSGGPHQRLNVFVPLAPVRWSLVLQMLTERLPSTEILIHAPTEAMPPTSSMTSPRITVREVPLDRLDDIQAVFDRSGEWTLVLGADNRRPTAHSSRCLVAPSAGVLYMVWREARTAAGSLPGDRRTA